MTYENVYQYILKEERSFQTEPVTVCEGYEWNMYEHIRKTVLYKNSIYYNESNRGFKKPFKNILIPILNLQYRATGFDVKDIELYVEEVKNYFKSFLVKKFHNNWARENEIDKFIDEMVESYVDFGGTLIKNLPNEPKPEVVPLQRLAFCDQTDLLGGPICEKHLYLPAELQEMKKKGWENVDDILEMEIYAKDSRNAPNQGKYVEVYELHGELPDSWLKDGEKNENESKNYTRQLHIVAFYKKEGKEQKEGTTLFRGKESKQIYDAVIRDPIYGRALGRGAAEELFHAQVWTNYGELRIKSMLDAASKAIYQTADKTFHAQNNLERIDNNEVLVHAPGAPLSQVNTFQPNISLFNRAVDNWEAQARTTASAEGPVLGETPKSGTPFRLQELLTAEGHSIHEYRKGKISAFLDGIYRRRIIPRIQKELLEDKEFMSELDLSDLEELAERVADNAQNEMVKNEILSGRLLAKEEVQAFKERAKAEFMKGGNRRFFKILKGEFKDLPLSIKISIAGKQKYLPQITEKLVGVLQQIVQNPAILENKVARKIFEQILENSGLSPFILGGVPPQEQATPQTEPQVVQSAKAIQPITA